MLEEADQIVAGSAAIVDDDLAVVSLGRHQLGIPQVLSVPPCQVIEGFLPRSEPPVRGHVVTRPVLAARRGIAHGSSRRTEEPGADASRQRAEAALHALTTPLISSPPRTDPVQPGIRGWRGPWTG